MIKSIAIGIPTVMRILMIAFSNCPKLVALRGFSNLGLSGERSFEADPGEDGDGAVGVPVSPPGKPGSTSANVACGSVSKTEKIKLAKKILSFMCLNYISHRRVKYIFVHQ